MSSLYHKVFKWGFPIRASLLLDPRPTGQRTHRLHQAVRAALLYEVPLEDGGQPAAGVGPGLTGVPAGGTAPHGEAGGAVRPHGLVGAAGLVHQEHGRVEQLAPAAQGLGPPAHGAAGGGGRHVAPGGRGRRQHAAGPRVQAVLGLERSEESWVVEPLTQKTMTCNRDVD